MVMFPTLEDFPMDDRRAILAVQMQHALQEQRNANERCSVAAIEYSSAIKRRDEANLRVSALTVEMHKLRSAADDS